MSKGIPAMSIPGRANAKLFFGSQLDKFEKQKRKGKQRLIEYIKGNRDTDYVEHSWPLAQLWLSFWVNGEAQGGCTLRYCFKIALATQERLVSRQEQVTYILREGSQHSSTHAPCVSKNPLLCTGFPGKLINWIACKEFRTQSRHPVYSKKAHLNFPWNYLAMPSSVALRNDPRFFISGPGLRYF